MLLCPILLVRFAYLICELWVVLVLQPLIPFLVSTLYHDTILLFYTNMIIGLKISRYKVRISITHRLSGRLMQQKVLLKSRPCENSLVDFYTSALLARPSTFFRVIKVNKTVWKCYTRFLSVAKISVRDWISEKCYDKTFNFYFISYLIMAKFQMNINFGLSFKTWLD